MTTLAFAAATDVVKAIDQATEMLVHQQHGPSGLSGAGLHALADLKRAGSIMRSAMAADASAAAGRRATDSGIGTHSALLRLPPRD
jgi:hypothetical protein